MAGGHRKKRYAGRVCVGCVHNRHVCCSALLPRALTAGYTILLENDGVCGLHFRRLNTQRQEASSCLNGRQQMRWSSQSPPSPTSLSHLPHHHFSPALYFLNAIRPLSHMPSSVGAGLASME